MKKIIGCLLLATTLLMADKLSAQSPIHLGVRAGLNFSDMNKGHSTRLKYQIGLDVDYEFAPNFYFMSGVIYNVRGAKRKHVGFIQDVSEQNILVNPSYLQFPMHLGAKINLGMNTKLVFRTGPHMAIGLGGKSKVRFRNANGNRTTQEHNYFGSGRSGRFDFGLGIGLALEHNRMRFGFGYDFGLIGSRQIDRMKTKHRNIELTLGYRLF